AETSVGSADGTGLWTISSAGSGAGVVCCRGTSPTFGGGLNIFRGARARVGAATGSCSTAVTNRVGW
ncbi:MAG: hypothetical protein ACREOG_06940, partial [Gemmatimonadaceae bacterium]